MKNIAILISSLRSGGAERMAGLLSVFLSKQYNVYLFIGDSSNIVYDYGGVLVDYSINGRENLHATIRQLKRKYEIDCSVSFDYAQNLINLMTKNDECVIISQRVSFCEMKPYPYRIATKIKRWYGLADKIVSLSYGVTEELVTKFNIDINNITTIYNFIDKKSILLRAEEGLPNQIYSFIGKSKVILNVGRLNPQKNHKKLLVQFSKICNIYDVKLIILGSGYMEEELKNFADEIGISSKVLFVPYCNNPFPYYKLASIFVLSSDYEGYGNVIIEAMINHKPCVCVDCLSGPREILSGNSDYSTTINGYQICERGILVEKADTDTTGHTSHLADAITILLNDKELSNKIIVSSDRYMHEYDNKKILEQWIDAIETTSVNKLPSPLYMYPELQKFNKAIVYGTGFFGQLTMKQLLSMNRKFDMLCFAVSSKNRVESSEVMGCPVFDLTELLEQKDDAIVFVGISDTSGEEDVINNLINYGFTFTFPDFEIDYY